MLSSPLPSRGTSRFRTTSRYGVGARLDSGPGLPGLRQQHLHQGCSLVMVAPGDSSDVADGQQQAGLS